MPEDFISGSEMITRVFKNISVSDVEQCDKIQKAWQATVSKISGNGEQLAAHSNPVDLKNGILLVESDHPGWNQMLQMRKQFILRGLNWLSGGVKIESLAFRVKGSGAQLADSEEISKKAVERYSKKIEEDQKRLEEMGYGKPKAAANLGAGDNFADGEEAKGGESLPPELNAIFERLKDSAKKE